MPPFNRQLRILTLHQPWASLMAYYVKQNETRSWETSYRGFVGIHSAASVPAYAYEALHNQTFVDALAECGITSEDQLPLGVVLAMGCLNAITPTINYRINRQNREFTFGNYAPGRFVWHFNDMRRIATPIPARGFQRLWTPDDALHTSIMSACEPPVRA